MKVSYDNEVDAVYIKILDEIPAGVIEVKEGINIDVTEDDKIVGIEILDASKKISLQSPYSYEITPNIVNKSA